MAHERLKEALHHIIKQCDDSSRLGAIRLNKILWFADTHAYRTSGQSITGDTYVKRQFGPVPAHVLAASRELADEGKIVIREVSYSTRKSYREFISLTEPEKSLLTDNDRAWLSAYASMICSNYSAAEISDISHDQVWEAADIGEEIPLYATFASSPGPITDSVREWANGQIGNRVSVAA